MNRKTLEKSRVIGGTEAECFVTIDGKRRQFASMHQFKAEVKVNIKEIPILGRRNVAHKAGKMKGSFSGKALYNSSVLREMAHKYQETGIMPNIIIQTTNEDKTSTTGRQTVILRECLFEGMVITQFDENAEFLEEDVKGVFGTFDMPEKFGDMGDMF